MRDKTMIGQANDVSIGNAHQGQGDINIVDNINNQTYNNIFSNKDNKEESKRPCLENIYNETKDKEGKDKLIRGVAVISKTYNRKSKSMKTLINLMDNNGRYISDHVQLDFKEYEYDYSNDDKSNFIEFVGTVEKYDRIDNTIGYSIEITRKIIYLPDLYINDPINYNVEYDEKKVNKFRNLYKSSDYYELIDKLQIRLNELSEYFGVNFIFSYIINLFTLNTATEDLYQTGIKRIRFNDNILMKLINLIASTIYVLETTTDLTIKEILELVTNICNVIQGVTSYVNNRKGLMMNKLCRNLAEYTLNPTISKSNLDVIWDTLLNRKRNFGSDPNPGNFTIEEISYNAYCVLYQYL